MPKLDLTDKEQGAVAAALRKLIAPFSTDTQGNERLAWPFSLPRSGCYTVPMPKIDFRTFSRFALCVIVAFSLGGCVVGGDEHGGTVSDVTTFTLPVALSAANSWCGRYGL